MNKKYKIIALMGKAGAGKDTILQKCLIRADGQLHGIVSYTTRPPREGEVDGKDYYFIDEKEFLNKNMFESTEFRGWYYGISEDSLSLDKVNIGVFNPTGVRTLQSLPNVDVIPVYVEVGDKTRLLRQLNRENLPDVEEIIRRYYTDRDDFADIESLNPQIIINEFTWDPWLCRTRIFEIAGIKDESN